MNIEQKLAVEDLNTRYAEAIDEDRLEVWPDFFSADGRYLVTTAENVAQGLPLGIMSATSRAMLRDRIKALRQANVYARAHELHGCPHHAYRRDHVVRDRMLRRSHRPRRCRRAVRGEDSDSRQPRDRHAAGDSAVDLYRRTTSTEHLA
jgi:hypothetical protein